jgi:hypothetical protein
MYAYARTSMPKLPWKAAHAADRCAPAFSLQRSASPWRASRGPGRYGASGCAHADRPGARTAAAVWRRKRLVQVELQHVGADLAGLRHAEERVQFAPSK